MKKSNSLVAIGHASSGGAPWDLILEKLFMAVNEKYCFIPFELCHDLHI